VTELELAAWDAVWQRFYDRGVQLGLTPNRSITRADDEMNARYGHRPAVVGVGENQTDKENR
jgi:hypothetical protein